MTKGSKEFKGAPARVVFADDDTVLRELLHGLLGQSMTEIGGGYAGD